MEGIIALHVSDKDNVATVFSNDAKKGTVVEVRNRKGDSQMIKIAEDVPFGHKIATVDIAKGSDIVKYGERIGWASVDIKKGDYVHIHNIEAARGRGDL